MPTSHAPLPLQGVRVVDLTAVIFGPMATQTLAGLGAEVIKVESLEGDIIRYGGHTRSPGMSTVFMNSNRGKRSLAIDLKTEAGRTALGKLVATADVFAHSMRRRAAERLAITYDDIRAIKPDIVYAFACGFASDGPNRDLPAYDDVIQAASGLASLAGAEGAPRLIRSIAADKIAGLFLTQALITALLVKQQTGAGQYVEVPMMECLAHFVLLEHLADASFDPPRGGDEGRPGYQRVTSASRRPHRTKDSYIVLLPYTTGHWQRFFKLIGRDDMAEAAWIADPPERSRRVAELYEMIGEVTPSRTTAEWVAALREIDVPASPVNTLDDLLDDPQLRASGLFEHYEHPSEGRLRGLASPVRYSGFEPVSGAAPRLGGDGAAILADIGYGAEEIAALAADGIIAEG
ncbi:MAG: CoA transferase [Magnetovibrio sp.]|nr:CoA transferase [Magnetovibrio sp.]